MEPQKAEENEQVTKELCDLTRNFSFLNQPTSGFLFSATPFVNSKEEAIQCLTKGARQLILTGLAKASERSWDLSNVFVKNLAIHEIVFDSDDESDEDYVPSDSDEEMEEELVEYLEERLEIDTTPETPEELYSQFIILMIRFLNGLGTATSYEEECKKLLGYDSYIVFTFDRVFVEFQKHVYTMISDHKHMCNEYLEPFKYELQRVNKFLDNSYRLNIQKLVGDEVCYILEFAKRAQKARIDEIDPPEIDLEKLEAENKALRYVQEFLYTPPPVHLNKESHVYLPRNKSLPSPMEKITRPLLIRNKLECKICIATFKLYFVEDTEDFMFRQSKALPKAVKEHRASRWNKFAENKLAELSNTTN